MPDAGALDDDATAGSSGAGNAFLGGEWGATQTVSLIVAAVIVFVIAPLACAIAFFTGCLVGNAADAKAIDG